MRDSYYNMKEKILPHMDLIENAQAAMRAADVAPRIVAIRGGTDGARLSWEGLPCPNLSTGGLNFHSIHEYIPVESLQKMTRVARCTRPRVKAAKVPLAFILYFSYNIAVNENYRRCGICWENVSEKFGWRWG